tara:strand:- start:9807 stop:9953 length:147 start_codon:yes stop_codon:yes gene_type:complete
MPVEDIDIHDQIERLTNSLFLLSDSLSAIEESLTELIELAKDSKENDG